MSDKILAQELYPYVEKTFADPKKIKEYENIIGRYIDKNSELLSAIGPLDIIVFTEYDKSLIYELIGVTADQIKSIKAKSKARKTKDNLVESPFSTLMGVVVRYFALKGDKDEKLLKLSILYLVMSMYPFIYRRSFPYTPVENIMVYTINHLSEKYKIKQTGNLMFALIETGYGAYTLHKTGMIQGNDVSQNDFIYAVKTRTSSLLKNIAKEFYKNHKDGKYLNVEIEDTVNDTHREADSSTYAINRKVDDISLKLIIDGPPMKLITMAAKTNKVSINELRNYVSQMVINDNKKEISDVIEGILFLYLFNEKNNLDDINSDKFLLYCLDIYKKANTNDPNIIKIKSTLDGWLERLGTYKKTQRAATINSFRRALYTFFVMAIMYYNK